MFMMNPTAMNLIPKLRTFYKGISSACIQHQRILLMYEDDAPNAFWNLGSILHFSEATGKPTDWVKLSRNL